MILNFATYIWINDPVDLIQIAVIKTQYTVFLKNDSIHTALSIIKKRQTQQTHQQHQ